MPTICFDLETHLFGPGNMAPRIVCLGAYDGREACGVERAGVLAWLVPLLGNPSITFVNANPAYDFACLLQEWPELAPKIFQAYHDDRVVCVQMACQLFDIATLGTNKTNRYALDALAERWLGLTLEKDDWRMRYAELDGVPFAEYPDGAKHYVLEDARAAWGVWEALQDAAAERCVPIENAYAQTRAQLSLHLMSCAGVRTDSVYVEALQKSVQAKREAALSLLLDAGWLRPNEGGPIYVFERRFSRSRKALKAFAEASGLAGATKKDFAGAPEEAARVGNNYAKSPGELSEAEEEELERLGVWQWSTVRVPSGRLWPAEGYVASDAHAREHAARVEATERKHFPRTDLGAIKVGKELAGLTDDPLLNAFIDWKQSGTVVAECERLAAGAEDWLHPRYSVLKETGRTSSGGGDAKLNMQNRRKEYGFRECFIPRPGYAFVAIDYDQIELCGLAQVQLEWFGRSALADTINQGRDVHCAMACQLAGEPYDAFYAKYKAGDKRAKQLRSLAKAPNFGLPGRLGERSLIRYAKIGYGVDIAPSEWAVEPRAGFAEVNPATCGKTIFVEHLPPELADRAETETVPNWRGQLEPVAKDMPDGSRRVPMQWLAMQTGRVFVRELSFGHIRASWARAFPEMELYFDHLSKLQKETEGVLTQLYSGRQRADCGACDGANTMFQGIVADGAKEALWHLTRACYDPTFGSACVKGSFPWAFVHDEFILQVPCHKLDSAPFELARLAREVMGKWLPGLRIGAEPAAMRRWTKEAGTVIEDGRLVCWEDHLLRQPDLDPELRVDLTAFFERHGLK